MLQVPDGSVLPSVMSLPERGVLPLLRVPVRVKGWLARGVALEVAMVVVVGVVAIATPESNETDAISAATAMIASCFFVSIMHFPLIATCMGDAAILI